MILWAAQRSRSARTPYPGSWFSRSVRFNTTKSAVVAIKTKLANTTSSHDPHPSNTTLDLVRRYRLSRAPLPQHLQDPSSKRSVKAKNALEHEAKEFLRSQRQARMGLKLYDTLTADELASLFQALNKFDVRQELQAQEHETISQAQNSAENDSKWEIETQTRHPENGRDQGNAAVGKRITKVYRFESWAMATKHFWKRLNECFEQQDHHGEVNVRFNPDTKLTEVRIDINTHTPKAIPKTANSEDINETQGELRPPSDNLAGDRLPASNAKRKALYGHPALTRKDFILAWSIDFAAFKTRQKQCLLDRRAAKRAAAAGGDQTGDEGVTSSDKKERGVSATQPEEVTLTGQETTPIGDGQQDPLAGSIGSQEFSEPASGRHNVEDTTASSTTTPKRAPRRSFGSDGLSLQHFLSRTQILSEYRKAVRATKTLPDSRTRRETLDWLRQDLEKLKSVTDLSVIKEALSRFRRDSKQFIPSVGLSTISGGDQVVARLTGRK